MGERVDVLKTKVSGLADLARATARTSEAWRDGLKEVMADEDTLLAALSELERLRGEVEALARFKVYVHQRLDEAGIPTHPDGPHSKAGCRIGDRLDCVFTIITRVQAGRTCFGDEGGSEFYLPDDLTEEVGAIAAALTTETKR